MEPSSSSQSPQQSQPHPTPGALDSISTNYRAFIAQAGLDYKQHQEAAVSWCCNIEVNGIDIDEKTMKCGLIADEMGLGKTIEILGTMYCNPLSKTLVVVPRALLEQWKNAIISSLSADVLVHHGKTAKTPHLLETAHIVVTTYGMISLKKKHQHKKIHKIEWDRIIFDKAHHVKNMKTCAHRGVMALPSKIRWLMTGTPIQNTKKDFYSLCSAMKLQPNYYTSNNNLVHFVENLLLRRTKKDVGIELPKLELQQLDVMWESEQERRFAKEIHSYLTFANTSNPCQEEQDCSSSSAPKSSAPSSAPKSSAPSPQVPNIFPCIPESILTILLRARQACVMPGLVPTKPGSVANPETLVEKQRKRLEKLEAMLTDAESRCSEIEQKCSSGPVDDRPRPRPLPRRARAQKSHITKLSAATSMTNSKINAVTKHILSNQDNKRPKLVFCHFYGEINTLYSILQNAGMNVGRFDGKVKQQDRAGLLSKIFDVLIMQIQTGCEGLNLQQYKEVYFVSPHWNPAVEDQAIARCHRIGQTQPVKVFHFIMEGFDEIEPSQKSDDECEETQNPPSQTLESHAYCIQQSKRELAKSVLPKALSEQSAATM